MTSPTTSSRATMGHRLPNELLSYVVLHTLTAHLHALFNDAKLPDWDALLVLTRTSPLTHDMAFNALHRSLGTRSPTRRTFAPRAPFLSTALPKDVRRKLRFIRRLCVADTGGTKAQKLKIKSLAAFCAENRDANSELAKAYVKYFTALAMLEHRAYNESLKALNDSLKYCALVKPPELAASLEIVVSHRLEDLRLAMQLDAVAHELFEGFLLPPEQAVSTLSHCLDVLEHIEDVRWWQVKVGGLPRLLAMMRDHEEYAHVGALRHRAGTLLLKWQRLLL
ncbi:hypothetical protein EXIGLDRAFT_722851 [Exidia glandulosa HHB12029]|uniref:Uncharacterized protein n=1 Tax=Exidia glandulosa HHB12029 TaxID=1314781 RepID=A0A165F2J6_EXIGL|nr:hypothetical protein EXIGLDRAFT_722851 [Exidia glandulosa HHB12029]